MKKVEGLASRLKHRMELQQSVRVADGSGGFIITWEKVHDVWAEILPARNSLVNEVLFYGAINELIKYYITIRYIDNINHRMRLFRDGDLYNIRSVTDPDGGKTQLLVLAERGVES
jgi:SPP1 family predicted phage head-tail adaptor